MTADEWHAVIKTNLDGVFYCSKHGAEAMRDGGRIVNVASISGIVGFHGQANYAAAKAGVIALTKVMAKELAKRGITVNAVAPGVIHTPMLDRPETGGARRLREADPRRPRRPAGGSGPCRAVLRVRGERLHHGPDAADYRRLVLIVCAAANSSHLPLIPRWRPPVSCTRAPLQSQWANPQG